MKTDNKNFLFKLSSLRKSAFSFLEAEMIKSGITDFPPSFGDILYIIHSQGAGYVKDIVASSYKDKSTVSNIINQLEKKGYVKKIPDTDDGRRVKVMLSKKAESYIGEMADISSRLQNKLFLNMSEEEQNILFMLLNKVENNIKE